MAEWFKAPVLKPFDCYTGASALVLFSSVLSVFSRPCIASGCRPILACTTQSGGNSGGKILALVRAAIRGHLRVQKGIRLRLHVSPERCGLVGWHCPQTANKLPP